jgi:hypothetical protein
MITPPGWVIAVASAGCSVADAVDNQISRVTSPGAMAININPINVARRTALGGDSDLRCPNARRGKCCANTNRTADDVAFGITQRHVQNR